MKSKFSEAQIDVHLYKSTVLIFVGKSKSVINFCDFSLERFEVLFTDS